MKRGHLIDDYNDDMNSDDYLNYYDSYAEGEEEYNENGGENFMGFFISIGTIYNYIPSVCPFDIFLGGEIWFFSAINVSNLLWRFQ